MGDARLADFDFGASANLKALALAFSADKPQCDQDAHDGDHGTQDAVEHARPVPTEHRYDQPRLVVIDEKIPIHRRSDDRERPYRGEHQACKQRTWFHDRRLRAYDGGN